MLSIVIPYYNGASHINTCVESIKNAWLHCKEKIPYEILIIVDSQGDEKKLIQKYGNNSNIQLKFNGKNLGISESRNNGWRFARGRYVYFIDQDDYVEIDFFNILNRYLDKNKIMTVFNGTYKDSINNISHPIFIKKPKISLKSILLSRDNIVTTGLVVFNKTLINSDEIFGIYSFKNSGCDDWAAYINLLANNDVKYFLFVDVKLITYLKHASNYGGNKRRMTLGALEIISNIKNNIIFNNYESDLIFLRKFIIMSYKLKFRKNNILSIKSYASVLFYILLKLYFLNLNALLSRLVYLKLIFK